MSQRFQLALNVDNLEVAIDYYSKLFDTKVNKRKSGYANFAIDNPALKLVLFENPGASERINHLGVENSDQEDVDSAVSRFKAAGIASTDAIKENCCFAKQNKVWSTDPAGTRWEWYRILEDTEGFGVESEVTSPQGRCC